jgi:transcriptional regulator GlxA family with amidase domain
MPSPPFAPSKAAVLAYPDVQVLDVTGPLQVFSHAGLSVEVIGLEEGPFASSSGIRLVADRGFRDVDPALHGLDTLLVAGGSGHEAAARDPDLLAWLRAMAPRVRRIGSVCTGAFVLAAAGLLDGRRAVTHWQWCDRFSAAHPGVRLEPDALHLRDGNVYSSAGVTAGMDLALAMVEEDQGHAAALRVARQLVLFLKRPGGQSQFSAHLAAAAPEGGPVRRIQDWIVANPVADLRVEALSMRAGMSPRNFARVFLREAGTTPQKFVEHARLDAARRRLELLREPVERTAEACGFGTAETMRRVFLRRLGLTPQDYRSRFRDLPPTHPAPENDADVAPA